MSDQEPMRILELDVDPQDHPEHHAPELYLPDEQELEQELLAEDYQQQAENVPDLPTAVVRPPRAQRPEKAPRKSHPRLRKLGLKVIALGAVVGVGVAGVNYVKDNIFPELPVPKSERKLEVGVGAPETIVVDDVSLNFMDSTSLFYYDYHSSLDRRLNPVNCDMDAHQKVKTTATTSIFIEQATIVKEGNKATITVDGDVSAQTNISFDQDALDIDMATGGVDACSLNNDVGVKDVKRTDEWDELDWAKAISYSTIADAGAVAEACAREEVGENAFEKAIIYNARLFSEKLQAIDPTNIKVILTEDFGQKAQDDYNQAVTDFYANFNKMATEYYSFNQDRKGGIELNATHLIDCKDHEITVKPNARVPADAQTR